MVQVVVEEVHWEEEEEAVLAVVVVVWAMEVVMVLHEVVATEVVSEVVVEVVEDFSRTRHNQSVMIQELKQEKASSHMRHLDMPTIAVST